MSQPEPGDIGGYVDDEVRVADGLAAAGYQSLLTLARNRRRRAGFSDTMMTEDVLHESFLKLSGKTVWQSQEHFLRTASLAMRQVVVDHARRKLADKRGGGQAGESFEEAADRVAGFDETPEQIAVIDDLLQQLAEENPRWLRVVDARYFAGLTEPETAALLGLSERTVSRDWKDARAWLAARMGV